jgi:predicted CoA-binding protein
MDLSARIADFLKEGPYAVAGASADRAKYGNRVLRCYLQHGLRVYPLNPREKEIEGLACVKHLASLPEAVRGLSIITPPFVTEKLVEEAAQAGIRRRCGAPRSWAFR